MMLPRQDFWDCFLDVRSASRKQSVQFIGWFPSTLSISSPIPPTSSRSRSMVRHLGVPGKKTVDCTVPMAPSTIHLPNGQHLTVSPVFGGLYFKSNELSSHHHSPFPPGWTVVLNSEEIEDIDPTRNAKGPSNEDGSTVDGKKITIHPFRKPTLNGDHLFISSISQPSSNEFKPPTSPTRQIGMMLWTTLYWYFQQPEPDLQINSETSSKTTYAGKPKGDWRIRINREGIFKSRLILPKLERMGIIMSEDSAVGYDLDERAGEGWLEMFVSRRAFWQLDARTYLFTLLPTGGSPLPSGTPQHSRPGSPNRQGDDRHEGGANPISLWSGTSSPGPFHSASHLPTYYPPHPTVYVMSDGVRHPVRSKPGRQAELLYSRFIPSIAQYLSFRIASASVTPCTHPGPVSLAASLGSIRASMSDQIITTISSLTMDSTDAELLHKWMNEPRVAHFWGEDGPKAKQEQFLKSALGSKHSIPLIGCWDGKPFGYFEIYWVKEDTLGRHLGDASDYDRGIHCLVGEQEFRGPHRVKIWLSALIHFCFLSDSRTNVVLMEPRVDNEKLLKYAEEAGFYKEREISLPHKQSNLLKIRRDAWDAPTL